VWKEFRAKIIKKRGQKCEACGLKTPLRTLHCHHADYSRFGGKELESDVYLLCKHCHRTVHKVHNQNQKKDLALVTKRVIQYMQKLITLAALKK
jgi:5-methylcytosine-specific restriction endonuclease McrA